MFILIVIFLVKVMCIEFFECFYFVVKYYIWKKIYQLKKNLIVFVLENNDKQIFFLWVLEERVQIEFLNY